MTPILHASLPNAPWMDPPSWRLPGVQPASPGDWLRVDEAYPAQMAERDRLIATRPALVHGLLESAQPAADELYAEVLDWAAEQPGFRIGAAEAQRPDGVVVPLDPDRPLLTLGRLVQNDFCLMEAGPEGATLTGAILCFPAGWTLAQKLGHPMVRIHVPVAHYDAEIARRVQRLFDAIRPGQVLWRANALLYDDPTLHQPRLEGAPRPATPERRYLRSERQTFLRLPHSRAVVFGIHTYQLRVEDLTADQRDGLAAAGL